MIYGYTNFEAENYAAEKAMLCVAYDISEKEDGYIRITLEISDELWDDMPEELMITAVFYSEDGTLIFVSPKYICGVNYIFEKASDFYKIFIWDMENMIPYSYAYVFSCKGHPQYKQNNS